MQVPAAHLVSAIGGAIPAQSVDLATIVEAPGPVRASITFALVILVGGVLIQRRWRFVDHTTDAALAHPLWSVGYGVATHAVIGFAAAYLASQLTLIDVAGLDFAPLGLLVGVVLVAVSGSIGFTVVGVAVARIWGTATDWPGLALGALVGGGIASIDPLLAGVGWVAIVSFGIGGAVREWLQASERSVA